MATKSEIEELLVVFSKTIQRKEIDGDIVEAYWQSLKDISFPDLKKASYKCMDDCQYFPRIKDIKDKLATSSHEKDERKRYTCPICNTHVHAMIDGRCWDCHYNIPLTIPRRKWTPPPIPQEEPYSIGNGIKCKCGHIGEAIKRPVDTGEWQCWQCYTGMSAEDYRQRIHGFVESIGSQAKGGI